MMGESQFRPMLTLGNSIVGVSIVSVPWCFKQCGLALGTILLLFSATITVWSCNMLLRTANMTRQHSYEMLGHAVFGRMGKMAVEMSNIGLTFGWFVASFVLIGDLLPPIVAQLLRVQLEPDTLRVVLMVLSAVVVVFPITLLRNVNKLSVISMASFIFYFCLILLLCYSSTGHLFSKGLWTDISWWETKGIIKCLPIFSLAFCCQSQMFIISSAQQDGNMRRMTGIVLGAISIVAMGYLMVAVFGYISYYDEEVKGDILANLPTSLIAQSTRFGFAFTIMFSFPMMVFPCRSSINSLFFHHPEAPDQLHVQPPIPQGRFVAITATIISSALTVAILITNVQMVLGLVGATLGSLLSFIFPGAIFIKVAGSNADYSIKAKICLVIGTSVLLLSTYVTVNSWHEQNTTLEPILKEPVQIPGLPPQLQDTTEEDHKEIKMESKEKDSLVGKIKQEGNLEIDSQQQEGVPLDPDLDQAVLNPPPDHADLVKEDKAGQLQVEEENKGVHEKLGKDLSKLVERVNQLEVDNKDLKERQEIMEIKQDEDLQGIEKPSVGKKSVDLEAAVKEVIGEKKEELRNQLLQDDTPTKQAVELPKHVEEVVAVEDNVLQANGGGAKEEELKRRADNPLEANEVPIDNQEQIKQADKVPIDNEEPIKQANNIDNKEPIKQDSSDKQAHISRDLKSLVSVPTG